MLERRSAMSCVVAAGLAMTLCACGGGGGGSGVTLPQCPSGTTGTYPNCTTPLPPPRTVASGSQGIEVGYAYGVYFNVDATGTLDVTVDYTFADSLLFFWLAKGRCTGDQFEADQCNYVATSFAGGKPRKLSAPGQTAGTYTLIVGNLGPKDESISYMVVFTQTAAGGSVGASARGAAEPGFLAPLPAHARQR